MLAVWNLGVFGLRSAASPEAALLWERFLHVGVIAVPVLFYHYVIVFLVAPRRDPVLRAGYAACALFWLASPTSAFMKGVTSSVWGFMPDAGPAPARAPSWSSTCRSPAPRGDVDSAARRA
jgi:hypothetical protein